jgi:dihydrofolate reductase
MIISIIVAVSQNNVIGKNNSLIWHISEDLKRFKSLTNGHTIIMGRKTYESLPIKPLPNRRNIIISSNKNLKFDNAETANSPENALKICENESEIFICGGAEIYKRFIPYANKIYFTSILKNFEGDTYFPEIDSDIWEIQSESEIKTDYKSNISFIFKDFIKKRTI